MIDAVTNKAILEKPEDNLQIKLEPIPNSRAYYLYVTLPTGQKLSFELYETTIPYSGKSEFVGNEFISAWYMTSIELLTGEVIEFEYSGTEKITRNIYSTHTDELNHEGFPYKIYSNAYVTKYVTDSEIPMSGGQKLYEYIRTQPTGTHEYGAWTYSELSLKKISTDGIQIDFITEKRLDYGFYDNTGQKYPVRLSEMIVKSNQSTLRTFTFGHSYFATKAGQENIHEPVGKRLRLDYVREGNLPPYQFTYDTRYELPKKTSLCYDVWGYYNGTTPYTNIAHEYPDIVKVGDSNYFDWEYPKITGSSMVKSGRNVRCNPDYITTGMLKKIKYPTGGYAELTFEPNTYMSSKTGGWQEKKGGGCRIAKIKTDSSEHIYRYQGEMGATTGVLLVEPIFTYRLKIVGVSLLIQRDVISSRSMVQLQGTQLGNYVGYSRVSETVRCDGKESSAVDYFYVDIDRIENLYVCTTNNKNGHLQKTQLYDNGTLIEETLYDYWILPPYKTPNLNAMRFDDGVMFCYKVFPEYREILSGKTVKNYFGTEMQVTSTDYDYDDNLLLNRIETKVNGKCEIKKITYSGTLSKGLFSTFKANNILNLPVEETTLISDGTTEKVIGSEFTTYNSIGQPLNTYRLNLDTPITDFVYYPSTPTEMDKDLRYNSQPEMSIEYEVCGKPKVVHFLNGMKTCYIWGYYGQCIIGKVENTNWADLDTVFSSSSYNPYAVPGQAIYDKINALRTQLPNAGVTTYYYDFGIGLKQVIFPDGVSGYYEYDEENRLKSVKDESGKVLNQYKYGYRQ